MLRATRSHGNQVPTCQRRTKIDPLSPGGFNGGARRPRVSIQTASTPTNEPLLHVTGSLLLLLQQMWV